MDTTLGLRMEPRLEAWAGFIGASRSVTDLRRRVEKVAPLRHTVLIQGETGTGKELVSRIIHNLSLRRSWPFVVVDCSSLTKSIVESELFGHKKGAFTGAIRDKTGLLEAGNGGTVFLDEIGDMDLEIQPRLLRVLEQQTIRSVGSTSETQLNVRFVAGTRVDLEAAVQKKTFREDLYYRLNVHLVEIPPLREREDDIPLLARHFLESDPESCGNKEVSRNALDVITKYSWPGNVRELRSAVLRASAFAKGNTIDVEDVAFLLQKSGAREQSGDQFQPSREPEPGLVESFLPLSEVVRAHILWVYERYRKKNRAARILGISEKTLFNKLKRYGVD